VFHPPYSGLLLFGADQVVLPSPRALPAAPPPLGRSIADLRDDFFIFKFVRVLSFLFLFCGMVCLGFLPPISLVRFFSSVAGLSFGAVFWVGFVLFLSLLHSTSFWCLVYVLGPAFEVFFLWPCSQPHSLLPVKISFFVSPELRVSRL